MRLSAVTSAALALVLGGRTLAAQAPVPGKNSITLRGHTQALYFYPASGAAARGKVLYLPGDIGLIGLGNTIAKTMASWGYDVYALDTRAYLSAFTGGAPLRATDVMSDLRDVGGWITRGSGEKVALVGWSEGAGLCLLADAPPESKSLFSGLITFGLTEYPVLGWHWTNVLGDIVGKAAHEPSFSSAAYLPSVSPSPWLLIQSTGDQFVPVAVARHLFSLAGNPKRFELIDAKNHRFEGNQERLFDSIRGGLAWIQSSSP